MDTLSKIIMLIDTKGIEQKELAMAIGIHANVVTDWKKGKSKSYLKHINKIANFFGVSADYLLEDEIVNPETKKEPSPINELAHDLEKVLNELGIVQPGQDLSKEQYDQILNYIKNNVTANADLLKKSLEDGK